MLRKLVVLAAFLAAPALHAAAPEQASWQAKLAQTLPLLGHRNWILIVDSAYPLQSSPGVETIDTRAPIPLVLRTVLGEIENSEHVRPEIFMDAELPYVSDEDAAGVAQFRANIAELLHAWPIQSQPHGKLIDTVDQDSRTFHVLVLKTNSTMPYSSVFIHLLAKYWSDEAEARTRANMGSPQ